MKVQFVMVLLVVLAGDQQSEVNALQEHHLEVVQLLRLNAANLGIEAVHTEGVVEELDRDHDTGDDNAVNGERVHRDFPTLNQTIDIDEREDKAFCTTVRVLQNPFKIVVNRNGRLAESREWSDLGNRDELILLPDDISEDTGQDGYQTVFFTGIHRYARGERRERSE